MNAPDSTRCLCGCGTPRRPSPRNYWDRGILKGHVSPWVPGHKTRGIGGAEPRQRILNSVSLPDEDGCWVWQGPRDPHNYPILHVGKVRHRAHRWSYEAFVARIPDGFTVDHICHNNHPTCAGGDKCKHRSCVNPEHLLARLTGENTLASKTTPAAINACKTHCPRGHLLSPENVYLSKNGSSRSCRECHLLLSAKRYAENGDHVKALARARYAQRAAARS